MRISAGAVALLAVIVGSSFVFGAAEPILGIWKLNIDKSPPSPTVFQSQISTLTEEDGMFVMVEDNITAKGMKYRVTCKLALDGKDYPMTGSIAGMELVSGRKLGPNSVELKAKKKDGSVLGTYWMTLSANGKMRITLVWPGADVSGPPARVVIHDRQ